MQHTTEPVGAGNGSLEEDRITEGAVGEVTSKEKSNETLNPRDTMRSDHQTSAGKTFDLNGIVNFALVAIVNPSLGTAYYLQFRVMQEH